MLAVTVGRTPGATSGGTLVTSYNHATGAVEASGLASIQLPDILTWVPFELSWDVPGQQTSQAVVLPATADVVWSATGSGNGSSTLDLGVIGNGCVRVWAKATATRAAGNLTQRVSNIVYGTGTDAPSAPVVSGFSISGVSSSAATVNGTLSDPDTGDTATGKLIVRTTNTAPSAGEWAGTGASGDIVHRAAYTGPSAQVTGLANSTTYYVFLRAIDSTSLTDIETGNFTTSAASNVAPTISSLSSDTQNSQGFTIRGTMSDPEGDTITSMRYIVCTTNSTPTQGELDGSTGGRVVAVGNFSGTSQIISGLPKNATYYWWLYATDAAHPNLAGGATITAAQTAATNDLTISGSLTVTPGSGSLTLDWADAAGGADGYDVEYGTTTGYGSSVSPDPATSAATITGLTPSTLYYVRVRAYDSAGNTSGWLTASGMSSYVVADSYAESNYAAESALRGSGNSGFGQSFNGNGLKLKQARFYLKRTGTLAGNLTAKLYAHTGTYGSGGTPTGAALATSATVAVSSVGTSFSLVTFTFDGTYTLVSGTKYCIVVDASDVTPSLELPTDWLAIGLDNTSPTHGGNMVYSANMAAFSADVHDLIFYVDTQA